MAENRPISNQELHDYLGAQSVARTTPTGESYVGVDMAPLHRASYDLLRDQVQASTDPLVRIEGGAHRLAPELELGVETFKGMLAEDIRTLRAGLLKPQNARAIIKRSYDRDGGTPPVGTDPDHLSLKEVLEYLDSLAGLLPDNQEKKLHADSLGLLGRLVDRWHRSQRKPGNPDFPETTSVPLTRPLPGSREGALSIEAFLTQQRTHFEGITTKAIADLGKAALNPSVIRQQVAAHAATHGSTYEYSPATVDTTDAAEAARRIIEPDVRSSESSHERHETSRIVAETIEAALGTAVIHLDLPKGVVIAHKHGPEIFQTSGLKTFGDGDEGGPKPNNQLPLHMLERIGPLNPIKGPEGQPVTDMVEAWGFTPTEDGSKDEYFDYTYNSEWYTYNLGWGGYPKDYPEYTESSGERPGGTFILRVRLPHAQAESFRQAVLPNPDKGVPPEQKAKEGAEKLATVRDFAHQVVVKLGTDPEGAELMEQAWSSGGVGDRHDSNPMRPPYDALPPSHRPYIIKPPSETGADYQTAEPLW